MLRKLLVCVNWLINWLIVDRRPNGDDHEHRRTEHTYYKLYANICCLNYSMFEDNLSLYASTCRKKKNYSILSLEYNNLYANRRASSPS